MSVAISVQISEPKWRKTRGLSAQLKRAASLALTQSGKELPEDASLTILLADDAHLKKLNKAFRGKDKPTNVLSFPAATNEEHYLGDVVIAYGVAAAEAKEAGKMLSHHVVHLAVHGVLHLLGYDHQTNRQAKIMEPLETEILARLRIADPYAA